jgi:hypothetical protein
MTDPIHRDTVQSGNEAASTAPSVLLLVETIRWILRARRGRQHDAAATQNVYREVVRGIGKQRRMRQAQPT